MAGNGQGQPDPRQNEDADVQGQQDQEQAQGRQDGLDTQEPNQAPPASDESGHGDNQGQPSQGADQPGEDSQGDQDKDELAKRREEGKLQKVQKELEEARKDLDRLKVIEEKALESPEKFERALVDYSGWDQQSARQYVEQLKAQGTWSRGQTPQSYPGQQGAAGQQGVAQGGYGQQQGTAQGQQPTIDPYSAAEQVFQQKQQAQQLQQQFFERVPEMDPRNVSSEKQPAMRSFAAAIEYEARRRVSENSDLNIVDALVDTYKDFTGKTDEQLESAREEGRVEGYLEANASKAGSSAPSKGYSPKGESSHGLTKEEMKQADAEGISYERFAQLKASPISEVE